MAETGDKPVPTRFRIKVLTTKLSRAFTSVKSSPLIGPEKVKGGGGTPTAPASRPRRTATATATASRTASTPTTTTTCSPTRSSSSSASTRAWSTPTATASRTASSTSPRSTSTTTTTSRRTVAPLPGQDAVPEPAVQGRRQRLRRRRPDPRRRVPPVEVHLHGQPHGDAHADAALLQRRRAVLAVGPRQRRPPPPTQPVATYAPPQQFRAWADLNGYGTLAAVLARQLPDSPSPLRPLRHGPRRRRPDDAQTGDQDTAERTYWDLDGDGYVSDDERDEDADGLTTTTSSTAR